MKRVVFFLAIISFHMFFLTSCDKSNSSQVEEYAFKIEGCGEYATLQQAFDAAVNLGMQEGYKTICLTSDAKGNGALVKEGCEDYIGFELGKYTYTLENDCSINSGKASLYISGTGGKVVSSGGDAPVFVCEEFSQ